MLGARGTHAHCNKRSSSGAESKTKETKAEPRQQQQAFLAHLAVTGPAGDLVQVVQQLCLLLLKQLHALRVLGGINRRLTVEAANVHLTQQQQQQQAKRRNALAACLIGLVKLEWDVQQHQRQRLLQWKVNSMASCFAADIAGP